MESQPRVSTVTTRANLVARMCRSALALALGSFALGAAPAAVAAETLNVAYPPASDFLPAFVAKDMGFFAKRNLEVTLLVQRIANTIPAALAGRSVDIGAVPPTVLLLSREGGVDLVNIAGISRHTRAHPSISLIAGKDSNIRSADDLKGKKVAVPGLYGGLDVMARMWVKSKGVPTSAITWVEVPFPQMAEFLARGQVDAVAAIEPFRSRILAGGAGYKLVDYAAELREDSLLIGWASTATWANAHRDTIRKFKAAIIEGQHFIALNPDQAVAIETKYLGFAGPLSTYSQAANVDDFRFYSSAMVELGVLKKQADLRTLIFNP